MQVSGVSDDGAYTIFPLFPDVEAGGCFSIKKPKIVFLLELFFVKKACGVPRGSVPWSLAAASETSFYFFLRYVTSEVMIGTAKEKPTACQRILP